MSSAITAVFWDLGGVVLSNGWDHAARVAAAQQFHLDEKDLESRHEAAADAFETGRMTLDAYLDRTVFFSPRPFTQEDYTAFIFSRSSEDVAVRAIVDSIARPGRIIAALNNESAELNFYRIRKFQLKRTFLAFFSSCYLGMRKPDAAIYGMALELTQREPEECVFIDDRPENLEPAARLGMRAIHFQNPSQLRGDLAHYGVG